MNECVTHEETRTFLYAFVAFVIFFCVPVFMIGYYSVRIAAWWKRTRQTKSERPFRDS